MGIRLLDLDMAHAILGRFGPPGLGATICSLIWRPLNDASTFTEKILSAWESIGKAREKDKPRMNESLSPKVDKSIT